MEKEHQPESLSTVTIKQDYAPSEVYSSEPPPAYHKPQSSSVQIAKIIAVTVVLCSVVLGSFLLASAYVTANASCRQLEQELELLGEAADRFQPPPQPEALIQEEPLSSKRHSDHLHVEETDKNAKEVETNKIDDDSSDSSSESFDSSADSSSSNESEEVEKIPIHIKLPLDFDEIAGAILEKNHKSKMNCIVEKKKAEEVVDHQPKMISLPFGVNLTTNPRYERLSGERMVIICESGVLQSSQPPSTPPPAQEDDDDQEEDTIMIQPVMIPIPQTHFETHMPQQMQPVQMQQVFLPQSQPMRPPMRLPMRLPMRPLMHPMESMRPPMPPPMFQQQIQIQPPRPQAQAHPQQPNEFPPNAILHHIVQQIISQKIMESQKAQEEQMKQQQQQQQEHQQPPQAQVQEIEESQSQRQAHRFEFPQMMHTVPIPGTMGGRRIVIPETMGGPRQPAPETMRGPRITLPGVMGGPRIPIPEEVLTQLNRLPNRDMIVAVSETDSDESPQEVRFVQEQGQNNGEQQEVHFVPQEQKPMAREPQVSQEMRFVQEQRQNAAEMNGRQAYARSLPVNIPVSMMPQETEQEQEPQAAASEEPRPHYVQPRSVDSSS